MNNLFGALRHSFLLPILKPDWYKLAHKIENQNLGFNMIIESSRTSDAMPLKNLVKGQTPDWVYAAYYFAMTSLFIPGSSHIARAPDGSVIAATTGMFDFKFKTFLLSHYVRSADEHINRSLLRKSFDAAAAAGATKVRANLDVPEDADLAREIRTATQESGLALGLSFRLSGQRAQEINPAPAGLDTGRLLYRNAQVEDGPQIWSLARKINRESGGLDLYALSNYERLCRDLSETCSVAEIDGHVVGFATGFMMPDEKRGLFLWQTGLHPDYQGKGIGSKLETFLIDTIKPNYLKFTVEASNGAANRTAQKKAEYMELPWNNPGAISSDDLGGNHEAEVIYYVGYPPSRPAPAV